MISEILKKVVSWLPHGQNTGLYIVCFQSQVQSYAIQQLHLFFLSLLFFFCSNLSSCLREYILL